MKTRSFDPFSPGDADMPAYKDEQLVLETLDNSQMAFNQLINQYKYRVLRTIASIISDEEAARDVAQETFLSAWSDLSKLKEKQKFGRWINQIAINLSKHWLRDQRKHHENTVFLEENAVVLTQELRYRHEELRQKVWEAIDELAAHYREAVILHYISGYSYKEISEMLSVPVSTIQGRLQQARNQLRKEFLDMVTKLQTEIRKVIDGYAEAVKNQDWEALRELCSDDYIFANSENGRKVGLEGMLGLHQEHVSDHKMTPSDIRTGVSSDGEMAWARFDLHRELLWDGVPMTFSGICTTSFEKRDSQWILTLLYITEPWSGVRHIGLEEYDQNMIEYYTKQATSPPGSSRSYYQELLAGHDVLEVACGTGKRTRIIAETANSVLATDVSDETLNAARSYIYPKGNVTFQKADAYSLEDINGMFSAGFHSHWFSHIPLSRRDDFLNAFHSKLQPGALVVFGDNSRAGELLDDTGNRYDIRIARDGAKYDIIKNWPTEEELRDMLKGIASDIQYRSFGSTWAISY